MCDTPVTQGDIDQKNEEETSTQYSLLNIPIEIFLHICSYLDARFLTHTLRVVCKHFYGILSDETIWRSRIGKRWNSIYPPLPVNSDDFNWRLACTAIEDEYGQWSNTDETMCHIFMKDIHYGPIDAVLLMNSGSLLISGSRDHSLVAWNIERLPVDVETFPKTAFINAHKGWIWNLASQDDTLYSCSWDATVKTWTVREGLKEVSVFPCKHAALSLACNTSLLAVGLYTRHVLLFDPRSGTKCVSSYCAHLGPVLALAMGNDYIISASEDRSLAVWDVRAGKIFRKHITLSQPVEGYNAFPMCLSYANNILYVGDAKGQLHLVNPTQGVFELVETYNIGHTGKMTGIQHSVGSVLTSSTDGSLHIMTPTYKLEPITIIHSQAGEVTRFDYKNNILAMGGTNCGIEVWMPKS